MFDNLKEETEKTASRMEMIFSEIKEAEKKEHDRINRVIFGEKDINGAYIDVGMQQMVQELHKLVIQGNGIISLLKLVGLVGAASAAIALIRK
jgi:hypothetical protein